MTEQTQQIGVLQDPGNDDRRGLDPGVPAPEKTNSASSWLTDRLGRWPFHPILLGIYPILALFAQNGEQVRLSDSIRVVAIALLLTSAAWLLFSLVLKDARKGGLIASAAAVMFFSFFLVVGWLEQSLSELSQYWVKRYVKVPVAVVLVPELLLLGAIIFLVMRKIRDFAPPTAFLNIFSIVLTLIPAYDVFLIKNPSVVRHPRVPEPFKVAPRPAGSRLPDIYYIILDGYARSDVMKSRFGFDNSGFLSHLESCGFYVARQSTANYCQTPLSLSSSLNAVYLDELVQGIGRDQTSLRGFIGKSNVAATLRTLGYRFVTFATGFDPTDHPDADVYLSPHRYWNGFERMVVDVTPLHVIWPNPENLDIPTRLRQRTLFLLERLPEIATDKAPTFTFAHVYCPHPPLIFGANGEDVSKTYRKYSEDMSERARGRFRDPAGFQAGYRGQSTFITNAIKDTIDRLLARSSEPPIIILQSDHGSELNLDMYDISNTDLKERMGILNAYYFPDRRYESLYQRISPVNSFRVVLSKYFGAGLDLLPDKSFYSTWPEPYRFYEVTRGVQSPDL